MKGVILTRKKGVLMSEDSPCSYIELKNAVISEEFLKKKGANVRIE